jgi:hypothetical protein
MEMLSILSDPSSPSAGTSGKRESEPMMPGGSLRQAKLCQAIQLLLRHERLEHLWCDQGPTSEAVYARRVLGRTLTGNARLLLLAAFDIWDHEGHTSFGAMIGHLPNDQLQRVFALALAIKTDDDSALDEWLVRYAG